MFNSLPFLNPITNSFLKLDNKTGKSISLDCNQSPLVSPPIVVKPFSCHRCDRTFNSKYNVIRHLKQYHAERRMFKCSICGRDYKWIDSLHKHMKLHKKSQSQLDLTLANNFDHNYAVFNKANR